MNDNIVDLKTRPAPPRGEMSTEVYTAQVDLRLTAIERVLSRLELQVWVIVCAVFALCLFNLIASFAPMGRDIDAGNEVLQPR